MVNRCDCFEFESSLAEMNAKRNQTEFIRVENHHGMVEESANLKSMVSGVEIESPRTMMRVVFPGRRDR